LLGHRVQDYIYYQVSYFIVKCVSQVTNYELYL